MTHSCVTGLIYRCDVTHSCMMKPQVGCTTLRLIRDDKSIQYIQEHHDDGGVIQTTSSTPNNLSSEEETSSKGVSFRCRLKDSITLSLLSTAVTHRVVHKVLINWRRAGGCRRIPQQQIHIYTSSTEMIRLSTFPQTIATLLA